MGDCILASHAVVGVRYVTKAGFPVTVKEVGQKMWGKPCIIVSSDIDGARVSISHDQLLWPRESKSVSQEAIEMSTIKKAGEKKSKGKGVRGGGRGVTKTSEGFVLHRRIGDTTHEVLLRNGVLTYRSKEYHSLKEVASAIRGSEVSGSGRSFFGLRSEPYIGIGREVWSQLESSKKTLEAGENKPVKGKPQAPKKARKPKAKAVVVEDEEDDKKPTTVGELVAKVMGKGR